MAVDAQMKLMAAMGEVLRDAGEEQGEAYWKQRAEKAEAQLHRLKKQHLKTVNAVRQGYGFGELTDAQLDLLLQGSGG